MRTAWRGINPNVCRVTGTVEITVAGPNCNTRRASGTDCPPYKGANLEFGEHGHLAVFLFFQPRLVCLWHDMAVPNVSGANSMAIIGQAKT